MELKPCDCIDRDRQDKLSEQGISINDCHMYLDAGKIVYKRPGFECIIPIKFMRVFAEWFLKAQTVK